MELYARVRRAVVLDKMSEREAARQFGLAREAVRKMLRHSVPPGYRRQQPARRPKLDAWVGAIDQILEDDKAQGCCMLLHHVRYIDLAAGKCRPACGRTPRYAGIRLNEPVLRSQRRYEVDRQRSLHPH